MTATTGKTRGETRDMNKCSGNFRMEHAENITRTQTIMVDRSPDHRRNGVGFWPHRGRPIAINSVTGIVHVPALDFFWNLSMKPLQNLVWLVAIASLSLSSPAAAQQRATYEKLVAHHARANDVPEELVHRVIVRESRYHPDLVGRGGTIGLMQIKLPTARGLGYSGDAAGLRDPDTNLTYGVKYLAGAWRAAGNDLARAMHLYASGYYHVAKRQRLARAAPKQPPKTAKSVSDAAAGQVPAR